LRTVIAVWRRAMPPPGTPRVPSRSVWLPKRPLTEIRFALPVTLRTSTETDTRAEHDPQDSCGRTCTLFQSTVSTRRR
jgi:hypothetical protein